MVLPGRTWSDRPKDTARLRVGQVDVHRTSGDVELPHVRVGLCQGQIEGWRLACERDSVIEDQGGRVWVWAAWVARKRERMGTGKGQGHDSC
jgi:hypothetical protein